MGALWQTFNSLNLTPYCEKTLKQKIRQTCFSSFQIRAQQAAKQEEQYMAGPLCCLSVTCQETKWRGNKWRSLCFLLSYLFTIFFFLLEKDSWVEIVGSIFFFTKVEFVKNKKNVETELDRWDFASSFLRFFVILVTHKKVWYHRKCTWYG